MKVVLFILNYDPNKSEFVVKMYQHMSIIYIIIRAL